MKSINLIFLIVILLSSGVYSQNFNIKAESQYLEIINNQQRRDLIAISMRNAEIISDSLFCNNYAYGSEFFLNLAESYYLLKRYNYVFFTVLRLRCLYPSERYINREHDLFYISCKKLKIPQYIADSIWRMTDSQSIHLLSYDKRKQLLLKTAMFAMDRKLYSTLFHYINLYENQTITENIPLYMAQWKLLYSLKFKPKKILSNVNFNATTVSYNFSDLQKSFSLKFNKKVSRRLKLNMFFRSYF